MALGKAECGAHVVNQALVRQTAQILEQVAVEAEIDAEHLGDTEREVAVRDGEQNRLGQEFQTHADGRVEMRLETTGRKELVRWILSWMPDVKVLAPKSLRDRIAEKLQDGLRTQEQDWIASVPQKKD